MFSLILAPASRQALIDSWQPVNAKGEALAFFMHQQVLERFRTQGMSGGVPWAPKKARSWGYDDGRSILTGHSAHLKESFQTYATATKCAVFSTLFYAYIHQNGKVIKAKKAKALFIPITDRAATSQRFAGPAAARIKYIYGIPRIESPYRVATRGRKVTAKAVLVRAVRLGEALNSIFQPLVKGRLHNGKLQKWDAKKGEYVDGTPDFIFLGKVTIPARPMLPDSPGEQQAQLDFITDMYHPQNAVV